nr:hypothetical protein [Pedobacter panaciterrae]
METSKPTFIMTTICLNFSYLHFKEKSAQQSELQLYQYGFSKFKSGEWPDLNFEKDNSAQTIVVVNHTVEQLFAIAYGAGTPINQQQTIIHVKNTYRLQEIMCYKLFVPQQQITNFYTIMQQNLNLEFPDYKITIELIDNEKYMIITDTSS